MSKNARLRLGVNIDHVATIRNARGIGFPDPVRAAILAEKAGADGITAHLREDRRHISDKDIKCLSDELTVPLNLEMAATEEMLQIALKYRPHAACIVPEKREERTTEGALAARGRVSQSLQKTTGRIRKDHRSSQGSQRRILSIYTSELNKKIKYRRRNRFRNSIKMEMDNEQKSVQNRPQNGRKY